MTDKELLAQAKENPWRFFTTGELVEITGLSRFTLDRVKQAKDSPFIAGRAQVEHLVKWFEKMGGWRPSDEN